MKKCLILFSLSVFCSALTTGAADDMPTQQPKILSIVREKVKIGHAAGHARNEQGWPAALEKAKHPYHYLALTSITGPDEAWYVIPYESHVQLGDDFKRADDDPVLSAELDRLTLADAEYVNSTSTLHAKARPELSYGGFPDMVQMRIFEITVFTVNPGHEQEFEELGKAYTAASKRAGVKTGYRTYEVLAGMPGPAYLVISSFKGFEELDEEMDDFAKTLGAANEEEKAAFSKGMNHAVLKQETNRFRVDPKQSFVSKETRNKAPDFWLPK